MADDSATLKITADTGNLDSQIASLIAQFDSLIAQIAPLISQIASLIAQFDSLNTSLPKIASSLSTVGGAGKSAGDGLKKTSEAGGGLSKVFEGLSAQSKILGESLGAIGIGAGEATEGVAGLSEALGGLMAAAPELLAVAAALAVVFAGFNMFKDAAGEAGEFDASMVRLQTVVQNQGGDWKETSSAVNDYIENLEASTSFTGKDAVDAFTKLAIAGHDTADSISFLNTAQGLADATGISLGDATQQLIAASNGRVKALEAEGILTKQQVADGLTVQTMLQDVYKATQNVAQQMLTTLPGALAQSHSAWEALMETMGQPLQGILVTATNAFTAFVRQLTQDFKNIESAVSEWVKQHQAAVQVVVGLFNTLVGIARVAFDGVVAVIKTAFNAIMVIVDAIADTLSGHWSQLWTDLKKIGSSEMTTLQGSFGNFGSNLITIAERIVQNIGSAFSHLFSSMVEAANGNFGAAKSELENAGLDLGKVFGSSLLQGLKPFTFGGDQFNQLFKFTSGSNHGPGTLDHNSVIPGQKQSSSGSSSSGGSQGPDQTTYSYNVASPETQSDDTYKEQEEDLKAGLDALDASLDKYKQNVADATTQTQKLQAEQALQTATIAELQQKHTLLSAAIQMETIDSASLNAQRQKDEVTNSQADAAVNTLQKSITALQKNMTALSAAGQGNTKAFKDMQAQLQDLKAQLVDAQNHMTDTKAAVDADTKAIDENSASLLNNQKALNENNKASAEQKSQLDALQLSWNTFNQKTLADEAQSIATRGMNEKQLYAYYQQLYQQDTIAYEQALAAGNTALLATIIPEREKAMQDMISAQNALYQKDVENQKAALQQETQDISTFLDDVLVKHESLSSELSNIYQELLQNFIKMVAGMIAQSSLFKSIFGNLGLGGSGNGTGGSGGLLSLFGLGGGSSKNGAGVPVTSNSPNVQQVGGLTNGSGAIQAQLLDNTGQQISTLNPLSANVQQVGGNTVGEKASAASGDSASGANVLGGALQGAMIGNLVTGITGENPTWGSVGGAVGGGIGTALGGPIGGIIGSGLGGLVGGLFGSHETPAEQPDIYAPGYGQEVANLQGSGLSGFESMIANGQTYNDDDSSNTGNMSEMGYIAQYIAKNPNNAAGLTSTELSTFAGMPSEGGIVNGKNGTFDLQNGTVINWQTLVNQAQDAISKITTAMNNGANAITPIFSITRMAPNFNTGIVSSWTQPGDTTSAANGTAASPVGRTGPVERREYGAVVVHINNPTVVGTGGMTQLSTIINNTLARSFALNYGNVNGALV